MVTVVPPERIDNVELMEVIAWSETATGNSGPYSTQMTRPQWKRTELWEKIPW